MAKPNDASRSPAENPEIRPSAPNPNRGFGPKFGKMALSGRTSRGVWVVSEQRGNCLHPVTLELVGLGRKVAGELDVPLEAVLFGDGVAALATELIDYGSDRVLLGEHPLLTQYQIDCHTKALTDLVISRRPEIILIGSTTVGRDLAPRLSTRLRTGLMADCVDFEVDRAQRTISGVKPVAAANLLASISCPRHRPQILTVRSRVLPSPERDTGRNGEVERLTIQLDPREARTCVLANYPEEAKLADIEDASRVVAVGQGVQCREDLSCAEELASVLGAALGATRPVVDAGWLPESVQIGQSGKTVRPRLYIACGIHGAAFHVVGMQNSDIVVAINEDPHAPIFKIATLGIVGDLREIVPLLTEKLKEAGIS